MVEVGLGIELRVKLLEDELFIKFLFFFCFVIFIFNYFRNLKVLLDLKYKRNVLIRVFV